MCLLERYFSTDTVENLSIGTDISMLVFKAISLCVKYFSSQGIDSLQTSKKNHLDKLQTRLNFGDLDLIFKVTEELEKRKFY